MTAETEPSRALATIPLEDRVAVAWRLCKDAETALERANLLGAALWPAPAPLGSENAIPETGDGQLMLFWGAS